MSYPKKKKENEDPKSNSGLPRVTMRGQINPSTKVSKVAKKGKLYKQQQATRELLQSIEKELNRTQEKHKNIPSILCTCKTKLRVYNKVLEFQYMQFKYNIRYAKKVHAMRILI